MWANIEVAKAGDPRLPAVTNPCLKTSNHDSTPVDDIQRNHMPCPSRPRVVRNHLNHSYEKNTTETITRGNAVSRRFGTTLKDVPLSQGTSQGIRPVQRSPEHRLLAHVLPRPPGARRFRSFDEVGRPQLRFTRAQAPTSAVLNHRSAGYTRLPRGTRGEHKHVPPSRLDPDTFQYNNPMHVSLSPLNSQPEHSAQH